MERVQFLKFFGFGLLYVFAGNRKYFLRVLRYPYLKPPDCLNTTDKFVLLFSFHICSRWRAVNPGRFLSVLVPIGRCEKYKLNVISISSFPQLCETQNCSSSIFTWII